jgi:hypothetical protein
MPTRGQATALQFDLSQPCELQRYFLDLNILFAASHITDATEKKTHMCQYINIDTANLWVSLPKHDTTSAYEVFCTAIYKLYPGLEEEHKWSILDMDKLIGEQLCFGIFSTHKLRVYYRTFYSITRFLIIKNHISKAEQSRAFICGFQPNLWSCITACLDIKFPDHHPDDAYKLSKIHDTTNHILTGTATSARPQHIHLNGAALPPVNTATTSNPAPPAAPAHLIKTDDFSAILDKFASTLMAALAGMKNTNNCPNGALQQDQVENLICIFCGLMGHFISDCLVCQHISQMASASPMQLAKLYL